MCQHYEKAEVEASEHSERGERRAVDDSGNDVSESEDVRPTSTHRREKLREEHEQSARVALSYHTRYDPGGGIGCGMASPHRRSLPRTACFQYRTTLCRPPRTLLLPFQWSPKWSAPTNLRNRHQVTVPKRAKRPCLAYINFSVG